MACETATIVPITAGGRSFSVAVASSFGEACAITVADTNGRPMAFAPDLPPGPVPLRTRMALYNGLEPGRYVVAVANCAGRTFRAEAFLAPGHIPTIDVQ